VPINLSTPVQHAVCSSTPGMSNHIGVDISAICRELCRPTIWLYPYHRSRGWTNSKIGNSLSNWSNRLLSTQTAEESSRRAYRRPICRWCEAPISPRRVQQRVPGIRHGQREQQLSKAVTPLPLVSLLATASTGSFHHCVSRDWSCLPEPIAHDLPFGDAAPCSVPRTGRLVGRIHAKSPALRRTTLLLLPLP
jgi:hypothetical protein